MNFGQAFTRLKLGYVKIWRNGYENATSMSINADGELVLNNVVVTGSLTLPVEHVMADDWCGLRKFPVELS